MMKGGLETGHADSLPTSTEGFFFCLSRYNNYILLSEQIISNLHFRPKDRLECSVSEQERALSLRSMSSRCACPFVTVVACRHECVCRGGAVISRQLRV